MTFQQDADETPVLFRKRVNEVTAVFPCEPATYWGTDMTCYAHIGQHGACSVGWYVTTRAAKPHEYADLKRELDSAPYGYRLKVYQRMQPWMRSALQAEQARLNSRECV
jgi:hypothetical protein